MQGLFRKYKMASAGAAICLPETERFFMELSAIITKAPKMMLITVSHLSFLFS